MEESKIQHSHIVESGNEISSQLHATILAVHDINAIGIQGCAAMQKPLN